MSETVPCSVFAHVSETVPCSVLVARDARPRPALALPSRSPARTLSYSSTPPRQVTLHDGAGSDGEDVGAWGGGVWALSALLEKEPAGPGPGERAGEGDGGRGSGGYLGAWVDVGGSELPQRVGEGGGVVVLVGAVGGRRRGAWEAGLEAHPGPGP